MYTKIIYMYIYIYLITIYCCNHITKCITVVTIPTPAPRASDCWAVQLSSIPQQFSWHHFPVWLSCGPSQPIDQLYCFENNLAAGFICRHFFWIRFWFFKKAKGSYNLIDKCIDRVTSDTGKQNSVNCYSKLFAETV